MRQSVGKVTRKQILESLRTSTKKNDFFIYAFSTKWLTPEAKAAALATSGVKWLGEGRIRCGTQLALCEYKSKLWTFEYTRDNPATGERIPGTGPTSYTNALIAAWTPN